MKKIAVLGSTGSIGVSTLKVLDKLGGYKVECLTAHSNLGVLASQANKYRPPFLCITDKKDYSRLSEKLKYKPRKIFFAENGLKEFCRAQNYDVIVIAVVGTAGLVPLIEAVKRGKKIALANKESIVCAGELIMKLREKHKARIIPVDSEHNAVFQCLNGENSAKIKRVILTASGGPFSDFTLSQLKKVTSAQALAHPRWKMGKKITIDSATLMNKGFEVIEAKWLFGLDIEQVEVVIHKQAVIHSMVEFIDNSILAQMGTADMRLPIQYALTFPERKPSLAAGLDFSKIAKFDFALPDTKKFPCLKIAYDVTRKGGTYPCALNAADEELVAAFLDGKIKFLDIPRMLEKVLSKHKSVKNPSLEQILKTIETTKDLTRKLIA